MGDLTAKQLADEAALYRQSGHVKQSKELLQLASEAYPDEICIVKEVNKLPREEPSKMDRCGIALAKFVDRVGIPVALAIAALLAIALFPMFVPAGY